MTNTLKYHPSTNRLLYNAANKLVYNVILPDPEEEEPEETEEAAYVSSLGLQLRGAFRRFAGQATTATSNMTKVIGFIPQLGGGNPSYTLVAAHPTESCCYVMPTNMFGGSSGFVAWLSRNGGAWSTTMVAWSINQPWPWRGPIIHTPSVTMVGIEPSGRTPVWQYNPPFNATGQFFFGQDVENVPP